MPYIKVPDFMKGKTQRGSWVYDREKKDLVPRDEYHGSRGVGVHVIGDIDPYKSIVTGEVVGGRRQHREHMKAHGLVEVGTEKLEGDKHKPMTRPHEDIKQALDMVNSGYRPDPVGIYRDE
jgi:hypothetical protein